MSRSSESKDWPGHRGSWVGKQDGSECLAQGLGTPAQFEDRKLGLLGTPVACASSLALSPGRLEDAGTVPF